MNIKKILRFSLLMLLCVLFVSSCHSNVVGHQIVGIWEHDGNRIEFSTNGYMKKGDEKYPYSVTEDKVTIDDNGEALIVDYTINSNGTLTMNGIIYYPVSKGNK